MRAVRGKGTSLERRLWAMLAGMRLKGWRKNVAHLAGKPDVAFTDLQVAVFIDGCFWHGCPYCRRPLPRTNREYWEEKIARNVELARLHEAELRGNGWEVIRVWEHDVKDLQSVRKKIRDSLRTRSTELGR